MTLPSAEKITALGAAIAAGAIPLSLAIRSLAKTLKDGIAWMSTEMRLSRMAMQDHTRAVQAHTAVLTAQQAVPDKPKGN